MSIAISMKKYSMGATTDQGVDWLE